MRRARSPGGVPVLRAGGRRGALFVRLALALLALSLSTRRFGTRRFLLLARDLLTLRLGLRGCQSLRFLSLSFLSFGLGTRGLFLLARDPLTLRLGLRRCKSLRFLSLSFVSCRFLSCRFLSCRFLSCRFLSCRFLSCRFLSRRFDARCLLFLPCDLLTLRVPLRGCCPCRFRIFSLALCGLRASSLFLLARSLLMLRFQLCRSHSG